MIQHAIPANRLDRVTSRQFWAVVAHAPDTAGVAVGLPRLAMPPVVA
jgi:elongation factor P--beta-lysine ligase